MISTILVAVFIGAVYLLGNILMFSLGKQVGRNVANLDNILDNIIERNAHDK